jgi:branched-chain amino acid aminotransferase
MSQSIRITKTENPLPKPDQNNLGFGRYHTDHMFVMNYTEGTGWHDARIIPYSSLTMDPFTMVLHYGQAVFEGLKAYRTKDDRILLFRPRKNMERLNISNDRVCIPAVDVDFAVDAIKKLVEVDKDWVPSAEGTSLYIRPFIIATDEFLGVNVSSTYLFIIVLSPVGAYYKEGFNPTKIYVETNYVRSVKGGVGYAKVPGNYAASLKAQVEAKKLGYSQVLWLDGVERKYVEEVGTSNVFFLIGDEVVTPPLEGSILPGITRDTTIEILKNNGYKVNERRVALPELIEAYEKGLLKETFATGTAAVISPIGELNCGGNKLTINEGKIGKLSQWLYNTITGIQSGAIEDKFGWTTEV